MNGIRVFLLIRGGVKVSLMKFRVLCDVKITGDSVVWID